MRAMQKNRMRASHQATNHEIADTSKRKGTTTQLISRSLPERTKLTEHSSQATYVFCLVSRSEWGTMLI
jgi:hypothetical protein